MRLLYAEMLKIRTAPRTAATLSLVLVAIVTLAAAGTSHDAAAGFTTSPETDIVDVAGWSTMFALLLGILVVTWEYRHGTITQTFLATPRRERVVAAKVAVAALVGAMLAAVAVALAMGIAEVWLGDEFQPGGEHWKQAGRIVVGAALWAVLGFGLGATLQSQVGALISALIWFLVLEFVLIGVGAFVDVIDEIDGYLPGEALRAFTGAGEDEELGRTAAGLVSAAYAAGLTALGTASVLGRDAA